MEKCDSIIALDFSEAMLKKAKQKISSKKVKFKQQDLKQEWKILPNSFSFRTFGKS